MFLSIRNLEYKFGTRTIFRGVSFDVAEGEYAVIVGPNGAGKTTILRCVLRILTDWNGEISFDGKSIRKTSRRSIARKIAYVQQSLGSPFAITVRQIVEMGRYPHLGVLTPLTCADNEIVDAAMHSMGVLEFANRMVDTLSGGERQKVLLAAAIAQQPSVLLLDEPTTFLDYKHQNEICNYLRVLNREKNVTILEVTHNVNRAVLDANHVIAISSGAVVYDGEPETVMTQQELRKIFNADFTLAEHPILGKKMIVP